MECGQLNAVAPTVKLLQTLEELSQALYFQTLNAEHMDMKQHLCFVSYGKGRMSLVLGTQHEFAWGMEKPVKEMGICSKINHFILENVYKYIKKRLKQRDCL